VVIRNSHFKISNRKPSYKWKRVSVNLQ